MPPECSNVSKNRFNFWKILSNERIFPSFRSSRSIETILSYDRMIIKYRIDDDDDWQGAPTRLETTRCNNNEDRVENEDIYPSSLWKIYRAFYTIFYIQGRKTRTRFPKVIKNKGNADFVPRENKGDHEEWSSKWELI